MLDILVAFGCGATAHRQALRGVVGRMDKDVPEAMACDGQAKQDCEAGTGSKAFVAQPGK